ncbi:MAG: hypothetical protein KF777_20370 [Planctomycetaceae bacterium]|nr:hypothetical protein [Planctomycetaceae bacterium]
MIAQVLARPSMFFATLDDLHSFMGGHAAAFQQLFGIRDTFTFRFSRWFWDKKGLSGAAGWAAAIKEQARMTGESPVELFRVFVAEFFEDWLQEDLIEGTLDDSAGLSK